MNHQSNAVGHILRKVSGATISYEDMKTLSLDTARTIQAKAHRCVEVLNALETVMMLDAITNEPKQCDPAFVKVYSARLSEIQAIA